MIDPTVSAGLIRWDEVLFLQIDAILVENLNEDIIEKYEVVIQFKGVPSLTRVVLGKVAGENLIKGIK